MNKNGYILIEMIIAVTVLAIVIVPISSLLSQSVYSNMTRKELMIATALAQEKIEELKALSFHQVLDRIGVYIDENIESNELKFKRKIEIRQENVNLIRIIVQVQGDREVVQLATYRGNY